MAVPAEGAGGSSFRILSLDGGGVLGTYTAAVLARLEEMSGKRIVDHFDLITGTSTGGIIAIGLGMGIPASELLALYVNHGGQIFPTSRFGLIGNLGRSFLGLVRPKHSQEVLKEVFAKVVGDKKLGDSNVRLVIPAFNADKGAIHLFKTAHRPEYKRDYLIPASSVALGTSAAPTYYTAFTDVDGTCFLDGGVWATCPVMVGLLEAVYVLKRPVESVSMLSVGTTSSPYHVGRRARRGGVLAWGWRGNVISLFMQAQTNAALGQARAILGDRFFRIDTVATNRRFNMDDAKAITELKALGFDDARSNEMRVNQMFLQTPAEKFVPSVMS